MDIADLAKLIELFHHSNVTKLQWSSGEGKILLEKAHQQVISTSQTVQYAPMVPAPETPTVEPTLAGEALHYVTAPLVGTFYRSAGPDKPEFAKVGDKVKKGSTLCIIEAMKLMNEIESDMDGEIVEILVENANPVEFGTKIFGLRPIK